MLPAVSRGFVFFSPETLVHGTMAPREPCLPPRLLRNYNGPPTTLTHRVCFES
jgi:hypothetical protein